MLKRTSAGWQVVSEKGKPLSKPDLTRVEAEERLKEVERLASVEKWVNKDKAKAAKK